MQRWLPLITGLVLVGALIALMRRFPDAWWSRELRRAYEVRRSGVLGRFTSGDYYRSALASLVVAVLLMAGCYGAYVFAYHHRFRGDRWETYGILYGFCFFLLAAVTFLAGVQSVVRGAKLQRKERRARRFREEHRAAFDAVREVLARHDPMGTRHAAEFDHEAAEILAVLPRCRSYEETVTRVHACFTAWFGSLRAGPRNAYGPLAQEIWNAWTGAAEQAAAR